MSTPLRGAFVTALAVLMVACVEIPPPSGTPATVHAPTNFPDESYVSAAKRGNVVYKVEPATSECVIYSYRGRLGHNHVIASHGVNGYAQLIDGANIGLADIYVPLDTVTVDETPLRAQAGAGFDTQPSESDIAGTRNNLLTKVLETEKFPHAIIHVERVERNGNDVMLISQMNLHGVTRAINIPAQLTYNDRELQVSGKFSLLQTDFGIAPFSVLGGLFQVKDEVDLHFNLRASRLP